MLRRSSLPSGFVIFCFTLLCGFAGAAAEAASLQMPTIFGDSMVLQRDHPVHVWGWTDPGATVTVSIDDQPTTATANADGRFDAMMPAMAADSAKPHTMKVVAGDQTVEFKDVLIGEVYVCSGQSNMAWPVQNADDADLEKLSAKFPNIRIISVPNVAARQPQRTFEGQWESVTPETIGDFSAVGYFFGRRVHQTLGVPVGLIDNAWGGSAAEAWVPQETLAGEPLYTDLIAKWEQVEETYDHEAAVEKWRAAVAKWEANGKKGGKPRAPRNLLTGNQRIGNLYYGCLTPIIGYPIRGAIWYQGESNSGRAYQYRDLFQRMITKWRSDWNDDFSFYWVQLADFREETETPQESNWAELREAQTMALELPNTGQAVIIDLGEAMDIHPKDKQNVAKRLSRWTFNRDFGINVPCQSPTFKQASLKGDAMLIDFDHVGGGLDTFDIPQVRGFAIAGEDKKFVNATAKIVDRDTVEVRGEGVTNPVAVRYGWANNPVLNLQSKEGLPATPFRTDDYPGVTAGVNK